MELKLSYKDLANLIAFAHTRGTQNAVPSNRSAESAFFEPTFITRNLISLQQRIYGNTKALTKIIYEYHDEGDRTGVMEYCSITCSKK